MSSFTGVSIITGGKQCTTSAIDAGTDSGYHLFLVKGYSQTLKAVPNGEKISSGPFMVGGHQWCIWYSPNGDDLSNTDFISLHLCRVDDEMEDAVEAKFEFSFVDQSEYQKPIYIRANETYNFSTKCSGWSSRKFMKRDALERSAYLKDDCFTIRCDIMVCNDLNASKDADSNMSDIHDHFNNLLQNKMGADVTFEVSGKIFAAHRCVLAARSKVFMVQLFGPMMEGTTSTVIHIKDMEAKVFAALLNFIYTDSFPEMDEVIVQVVEGQEEEVVDDVVNLKWLKDLFVAADRYDIQQLKLSCEKRLSKNIDVSSVASTLALAEQHHCHSLKAACFKFIQVQSPKRLDKVMATDDWKHMIAMHPSVLSELLSKLVSCSQKKVKKRKLWRM